MQQSAKSKVAPTTQLCTLPFFSDAIALTSGFPDGTGPIWLDNVQCNPLLHHTRLSNCAANNIGTHNCNHSEDAGVRCTGTTCPQGAIRLQGGSEIQGRVEICNNHVWGTVCDDFWGTPDAQVACRQLGFPTTSKKLLGKVVITFGSIILRIYLQGYSRRCR